MSENLIKETLERIGKLTDMRTKISHAESKLESAVDYQSSVKIVNGVDSNEYAVATTSVETVQHELDAYRKELETLSYKRSELKPALDEIVDKFDAAVKEEQQREFHLDIGNRKVYKILMDYLNRDVKWSAKTVPALMALVSNMKDNESWTKDKEFDNIIILRSSNILSLYKFIIESLEGKGFYEAKTFIEAWTNCGKPLSDAVNTINKEHQAVRDIATELETIEAEYNRSEDDLPHDDVQTTKDEVAPEA